MYQLLKRHSLHQSATKKKKKIKLATEFVKSFLSDLTSSNQRYQIKMYVYKQYIPASVKISRKYPLLIK